jgi:hypothetical protein
VRTGLTAHPAHDVLPDIVTESLAGNVFATVPTGDCRSRTDRVVRGQPPPSQMFLLGVICVLIALASDTLWPLIAGTARTWFERSPRRLRAIGAGAGAVIVGLGVRTAARLPSMTRSGDRRRPLSRLSDPLSRGLPA